MEWIVLVKTSLRQYLFLTDRSQMWYIKEDFMSQIPYGFSDNAHIDLIRWVE